MTSSMEFAFVTVAAHLGQYFIGLSSVIYWYDLEE